MENFHYTMADPQMVPADLLDVVLPEDVYRFNYNFEDGAEAGLEAEEEDREEAGVLAAVSRLVTSPFSFLFYIFEMLIEEKIPRRSYQQHEYK